MCPERMVVKKEKYTFFRNVETSKANPKTGHHLENNRYKKPGNFYSGNVAVTPEGGGGAGCDVIHPCKMQ
jgi:hypothetical protein